MTDSEPSANASESPEPSDANELGASGDANESPEPSDASDLGASGDANESAYTVGVIGGSGYAGGEVCRLVVGHPAMELAVVTSREYAGRSLGTIHPNLRELDVRFTEPEPMPTVDVLFAATPHGVSMEHVDRYRAAASLVVDLSADFRLPVETYETHYEPHAAPEHVADAAYGVAEFTRDQLQETTLIAVGGCNATATLFALAPLVEAGLVTTDDRVVADLKVGSSENGASGGPASSHAERSGVVRPYAPTGHRHEAEVAELLGIDAAFTVHAVGMTRGAAVTCHAFPAQSVSKRDLWNAYRAAYDDEPFVRLVAGGSGTYRYPEPKVVAGTNVVEVGFEPAGDRIVAFAALDNLQKGAAGQAVQAANCALDLPETMGLQRRGLHPVGSP